MDPSESSPSSVPSSAFVLPLAAAFLFALAPAAGKILLQDADPVTLGSLLYLGAALGVLPPLVASGRLRSPLSLSRRNRVRLLGAVMAGGVLAPVAFLLGLRMAAASSVSLWLNGEAVATAVLGHVFFRDRLGGRGWMAVLAVFAGGALLAAGERASGFSSAAWVALACALWGLDNHWTALQDDLTPLETTFWKGAAAGTFNAFLAAGVGESMPSPSTIALALPVGALAYGASIALYIQGAQRLGAVRAQLVFASSPFLGAILAAFFLKEQLGLFHAGGGLLFLGAWFLLARDRHVHLHVHEALEHEHTHRHDDGHHLHEHPGLPAGHRHVHRHRHEPLVHAHPHAPDIHHRHSHPGPPETPPPEPGP